MKFQETKYSSASVAWILSAVLGFAPTVGIAAGCPTDAAAVATWREALIRNFDLPYNAQFGRPSLEAMRKCEKETPALWQTPAVAGCLKQTRDFLEAVSADGHPAPGAAIPYDEQPDARANLVPDDLQDQKFLQLVSDRKSLPDAKKFIEKLNAGKPEKERYIFGQYSSQFVVSPDASASPDRLVVFVPGVAPIPDRFVLFSVSQEGNQVKPNLVSVISVQKYDSKGKPLDRNVVRFKTHWRDYKEYPKVGLSPLSKPMPHEMKCYSCHKLGARSILPAEGSVSPADRPAIAKMNEVIDGYGVPAYGGVYNPADWGPPIGIDENSSPASVGAFQACLTEFKRTLPKPNSFDSDKVTKAARCTECHNDKKGGVGPLNFPLGGGMGSEGDHVYSMVVSLGTMPADGALLAPSERQALTKCLVQDYYGGVADKKEFPKGKLAQWLTRVSCTDAPTGTATSGSTGNGQNNGAGN